MVQHLTPELSMIQALSMEGSALDIEPSTILTSSVEGPTPDTRTIRDSGPKRGRSSPEPRTVHDIGTNRGRSNLGHRTVHDSGPNRGRSSPGHRTIHDIDLQRGRFNTWIPNHPRYVALAWKVQPMNPEPSAPKPQTVEGSRRASNRALPQKRKRPASLPISHFSSYFGTD